MDSFMLHCELYTLWTTLERCLSYKLYAVYTMFILFREYVAHYKCQLISWSLGTDTYDIQKIIEYPGFTVPVPLGFVDDSVINGMPPIQQHQLKKTLMEDTISKVSLVDVVVDVAVT